MTCLIKGMTTLKKTELKFEETEQRVETLKTLINELEHEN